MKSDGCRGGKALIESSARKGHVEAELADRPVKRLRATMNL